MFLNKENVLFLIFNTKDDLILVPNSAGKFMRIGCRVNSCEASLYFTSLVCLSIRFFVKLESLNKNHLKHTNFKT